MEQAAGQGLIDRATKLATTAALTRVGDSMLKQGPVTLILMDFRDLEELAAYYNPSFYRQMLELIGRRLANTCGSTGLAARVGHESFALLFLKTDRVGALDILAAKLGRSASFELDSDQNDVVMSPDIYIQEAAADDTSFLDLYNRCRLNLERVCRPAEVRFSSVVSAEALRATAPINLVA
ncbi:diguanylate cyclase [Ramlibacter sp. AN1015]|uniref:diguanylate cyclase domain-containing protein n=1 Tax=Ramlibacter sp. AN1015 TaxID=3133428 RepID=UPI0030C1CDC0